MRSTRSRRATLLLEPFPLFLSARSVTAQLARTEEAAKRALVKSDASAKGGAAQRLLDADRLIQQMKEENADLAHKYAM